MVNDSKANELEQIGAIMSSIGINTVKLAEKLKEHILNCPGGMQCTAQLLKEDIE
jgi:hypothetical protein